MGGLSINGRSGGFNFSYDGVTNKDTGSNSGNYAAPGARFDRGSPRPDVELPGRVRPQLGRDDHRRHPQRVEGLPRQRGLLQARRRAGTATSSSAGSSAAWASTAQCEPPDYDFDNGAWTLGGPVLIPGTSFNRGRNKLFFFWSQDLLARTDPGGLNERRMPTALERQRRLLADVRQPGPAGLHPRSAARRATATSPPAARPASRAT